MSIGKGLLALAYILLIGYGTYLLIAQKVVGGGLTPRRAVGPAIQVGAGVVLLILLLIR